MHLPCHEPAKGSIILHDAWPQVDTWVWFWFECCIVAGQGRPSWSRWLTAVLLMALCSGTAFMLAPPTTLPPPAASWQLAVSGAHLCCNYTCPLLQFVQQHQCERSCIVYHAQCSLSCPAAYAFEQIAWERCHFCVHHPFPVIFYRCCNIILRAIQTVISCCLGL